MVGSEDCLYLNVFTKRGMEGDDAHPKKVMVWFHGGAFIFGGIQHYPANYLMEENIVLVNSFEFIKFTKAYKISLLFKNPIIRLASNY